MHTAAAMEVLFENQCVLTREVFLEFSKAAFRHTSRLYRLGALATGCVFLAGAVFSLFTQGAEFGFVLMSIGVMCMVFTYFRGYVSQADRCWRHYRAKYGENARAVTRFYGDSLKASVCETGNMLEYSRITCVLETQTLIILLAKRSAVILRKDGFAIGDEREFPQFLQSKAPQR